MSKDSWKLQETIMQMGLADDWTNELIDKLEASRNLHLSNPIHTVNSAATQTNAWFENPFQIALFEMIKLA